MATYDTLRNVVAGPSTTNRFFSAFTGMASTYAVWNDARVTRKALSKLSNHELNDLGLSRGDIANMSGRLKRY